MLLEKERGLTGGEAFVNEVMRDLPNSRLSPAEKLLLQFVDKVNHNSIAIGPADMDSLHTAGWTDEAIFYAISVCSLFNFYNRWIDATGVHPLSDEAHRNGGVRSATVGYFKK